MIQEINVLKHKIEGVEKMKNKKGFTLIELLAVIVILAIIALIAVPVIMNIITQAKKSAFKDTAYGIIKAGELYYADKALNVNGMTDNVTINLPDADNTLNLNGEMPNGVVKINKNGNVALAVTNGKYCITKYYDDTDISIRDSIVDCEIPSYPFLELTTVSSRLEVNEIDKCAKDGICEVGTAFAIKVNDTETYKFYVISDDGDEVTLIMSENLGTSPWISSSDYGSSCYWKPNSSMPSSISFNPCVYKGPRTLLNNLDSATSEWTNIPKRDYTYNGANYSNINVNMRASILSQTQLSTLITNHGSAITQYLSAAFWTTDHINTASVGGNSPNLGLYWNGIAIAGGPSVSTSFGIRPVITLVKKNLFVLVEDFVIAEEVEINSSSTYQISATISPSNVTNGTLVYKSSNTSVATVSDTGLITGVSGGNATITATTIDGSNISKVMNVEVIQLMESLDLGTTTLSMVNGTTYQILPTITPDNVYNKTLSYSSGDTSIATVDENGLVTGVKAGTTTITVSSTDGSNITQTIEVTIRQLAESLTLNKTELLVGIGHSSKITATVLPSDTSLKTLLWTSSDEDIATVENGVITGVSDGIATITATTTDGTNISQTIEVTVRQWVESLDLGTTTLSVLPGDTYQIKPTITPDNAYDKTLIYTSNKPGVATVSETGLITASAPGTATITVKATDGSNVRKNISVTVIQLAESITLDKETVTVGIDEDFNDKVTAAVLPSNTSNPTLTWKSNDTSIATVENGTITGVTIGSTTVTVTTTDGTNISKTITVNVVESVENGIMQSIDNCINEGTCSDGTMVRVAVNDTETYKFYVLADTGSKLTLIMNKNLGATVNWISPSDYDIANTDETDCNYAACTDEGPITALEALKERTSGWTNISEKEYTYKDDGGGNYYKSFSETMRARMLTYTEAKSLGCTSTTGSCPSWLYGNGHYWTTTAHSSGPYYGAWYVNVVGRINYSYVNNNIFGIRPVIEITK